MPAVQVTKPDPQARVWLALLHAAEPANPFYLLHVPLSSICLQPARLETPRASAISSCVQTCTFEFQRSIPTSLFPIWNANLSCAHDCILSCSPGDPIID